MGLQLHWRWGYSCIGSGATVVLEVGYSCIEGGATAALEVGLYSCIRDGLQQNWGWGYSCIGGGATAVLEVGLQLYWRWATAALWGRGYSCTGGGLQLHWRWSSSCTVGGGAAIAMNSHLAEVVERVSLHEGKLLQVPLAVAEQLEGLLAHHTDLGVVLRVEGDVVHGVVGGSVALGGGHDFGLLPVPVEQGPVWSARL